MKLSEMIKVMQHYDSGGVVEFSEDDFKVVLGEANEKDDGDLCWDWDTFKYRIKEPKQKVTIEKWLCIDDYEEYVIIEVVNISTYNNIEKVKLIETYEVEL